MRQRLISAAVLVPVVVIVFLLGTPWLPLGIAVLGAAAAYETAQLVRRAGLPANTWLAVAAPPLAVLTFELTLTPFARAERLLIPAVLAVWLLLCALVALPRQDPGAGFRAWTGTLLASLYPATLAFMAAILHLNSGSWSLVPNPVLASLDPGRIWLLILVVTVWTLDSAAYLAGKFHGRGLFMTHISPNKTWSGAIGGAAAAVAMCALLFWMTGLQPILGVVLGVAIGVLAQAGDLAESMLKRAAGAKDSGTIIPGHGGVLDRIDSFLFAAPVMYLILLLYGLRPWAPFILE